MPLSTEVRAYRDRTKHFAKEKAELRLRVTNEYHRLCKDLGGNPNPNDEHTIRESLKERFELTDRRLGHILDNQSRYLNAKEQAFTSGLVMNHYVTLLKAANEAIQGYDEYLEFVEQEKEDGVQFINIEQYASAKGVGVKAVTPREAQRSLLRAKFDIVKDSFEPLKALAPKIIQVQGDGLRFDTMEELEAQEKIEMNRLKISKGETDEED